MTAKLKITAIMPYPAWVGTRNHMLVKVETDCGEAKRGFDSSNSFPEQPRLDGPDYSVNDLPRVGVEANEEAIKAECLRFRDAPKVKRRDDYILIVSSIGA